MHIEFSSEIMDAICDAIAETWIMGLQTMYLHFDKPRPKAWKRVVVLIVALLFVGLGCTLALVLPAERLLQHCIKWALSLFLAGSGLWLLVVAFRGDGRQLEKT